eukprot:GSChrysophyteH1.ASY1.ANO1.2748.1 assembled CDS
MSFTEHPQRRETNLETRRLHSLVDTVALAKHVIYESPARFEYLQALWKRVEDDPVFSKQGRNSLGHTDRYVLSCGKVVRFSELVEELCQERGKKELTLDELYDIYIAVDENLPLDVHLSMFIPLMQYHTSPAQRKAWLHDAMKFNIIGAYAQTEIAHGSNVQGIETIATYFPAGTSSANRGDGYFEIHSPTLSSLKWWPGGLGHTCTHAVVYAKLMIRGKNYGLNSFLVQLRKPGSHEPLPGIECGDIGPKFGYNSMDNGYCRFTRHIIPRTAMLAGFAQVSPDGTYTKQSGQEKIAYGIMLDVRVRIVANSSLILAKALMIAIRYSFMRLQGGVPEISVMEYATQQRIIIPALAFNFAIHFVGQTLKDDYKRYSIHTILPMLHIQSAGLKALITKRVYDHMEDCRKACGEIMTSYLPMCTLEGTYEVLSQQTGRGLLKMFMAGKSISLDHSETSDSPAPFITSHSKTDGKADLQNPHDLARLVYFLYVRVSHTLELSRNAVVRFVKAAGTFRNALAACNVELMSASEAYSEYVIAHSFLSAGQYTILSSSGLFFACGVLQGEKDMLMLQKATKELCRTIKNDSLNLCEAWNFSDTRLDSTLGRHDGEYVQALYDEAQKEPLNIQAKAHGGVSEGYRHHLHKILSKKFSVADSKM